MYPGFGKALNTRYQDKHVAKVGVNCSSGTAYIYIEARLELSKSWRDPYTIGLVPVNQDTDL